MNALSGFRVISKCIGYLKASGDVQIPEPVVVGAYVADPGEMIAERRGGYIVHTVILRYGLPYFARSPRLANHLDNCPNDIA